MTSKNHQTGTDRIFEAIEKIKETEDEFKISQNSGLGTFINEAEKGNINYIKCFENNQPNETLGDNECNDNDESDNNESDNNESDDNESDDNECDNDEMK